MTRYWSVKFVFYRLTPRNKTYLLTFWYDDFMMSRGCTIFSFIVRGRKRQACVSVLKECAYVIRNRIVYCVLYIGAYSTAEYRYLYSLGEYICLLLIVYLKISLKWNAWYILFTYLSQHFKAKFSCKEYNFIKVFNKLLVIQI